MIVHYIIYIRSTDIWSIEFRSNPLKVSGRVEARSQLIFRDLEVSEKPPLIIWL